MDIENCAAIVTGAASGLGAATAARLAAIGARVTGLDLNIVDAPSVAGVGYVACDVTDERRFVPRSLRLCSAVRSGWL